jgi:hypothetical protein
MIDKNSLQEILLNYDLINSYFYNTHDLRIIMNKHKSTSLVIIRYPIQNMYIYDKLNKEDVDNDSFRGILMAQKVKYIFTDINTNKYNNIEIYKDGVNIFNDNQIKYNNNEIYKDGVNIIGEYDRQIRW